MHPAYEPVVVAEPGHEMTVALRRHWISVLKALVRPEHRQERRRPPVRGTEGRQR